VSRREASRSFIATSSSSSISAIRLIRYPNHSPPEHVPVQVEDRLPAAGPDVDDDAVVLEPDLARGLGDELEHPLRLLGRKLADVAERLDMALGMTSRCVSARGLMSAIATKPFALRTWSPSR
jgi:hypothetical protein